MGPSLACNHYKAWAHYYECRRNYCPITHIIKRDGPNYYVRKGVIISSGFIVIVMGPSVVITTDYRGWSHCWSKILTLGIETQETALGPIF